MKRQVGWSAVGMCGWLIVSILTWYIVFAVGPVGPAEAGYFTQVMLLMMLTTTPVWLPGLLLFGWAWHRAGISSRVLPMLVSGVLLVPAGLLTLVIGSYGGDDPVLRLLTPVVVWLAAAIGCTAFARQRRPVGDLR